MAIRNRDEALQAMFAAKRAGQGSIYGGPPIPQPKAAAPQAAPQAGPMPGSGYADSILSQLGDRKPKGPDTGLNPFSSGLGTSLKNGLGTVLGGAAKVLTPVSKTLLLGAEELSEGISGALGMGGEFESQLNADGTLNEFGKQSNWDKINDPEYGFGKLMGDTFGDSESSSAAKWGNRALGLVGDIAFDPLTYIAGGATKSANAVGKTGRQALAQSAAKLNLGEDVVRQVSRYGPAYLDDATRKALGVKDAGIYWGVGEGSFKIPGTSALGRRTEKAFTGLRDKTVTSGTMWKKARGDAALATAKKAVQTGRDIDGVTPQIAAKFLNNIDVQRAGINKYRDIYAAQAQDLMSGWDDRVRGRIMHEVEAGGALSPEATQWVAFRDDLYKFAKDNDVDMGYLGPNYVPHRMTREGHDALVQHPQLKEVLDRTSGQQATKKRGILPGQGPQKFDGVMIDFGDARLETIEAALQKAFPGRTNKWMETNSAVVMERYIDEVAKSVATVDMLKHAVDVGDIRNMKAFSDEMVETAANATANKEMAKMLKNELARREKEMAGLRAEAFEIQREMAEALHKSVDDTLRAVGDERKFLRKDIKEIYDDLGSNADRQVLHQKFVQMKERANRAYSSALDDLDRTNESLTALEMDMAGRDYGAGIGVQRSAAEEAAQLKRMEALELQRETLEDALVDYRDAVSAAHHLEDMVGARLAAAESMEEVADSPQLLKELMGELKGDGIIEYQVPKVVGEKFQSPRVKALEDKIKDARTQDAARQAVDGLDNEARALGWAGNAQASAEAMDTAADVLLAEVRGLKAEVERVSQWVPKYSVDPDDVGQAAALREAKKELHMKRMTQQKAANAARQDRDNVWTVQVRSERLDEMQNTLESSKWDISETYGRNLNAGSAYRDAVELESVKLQSQLIDSEAKLSKATLEAMEENGAHAVYVEANTKASQALAEVQAYKKRIAELDEELTRLTTNPYEVRVRELESQIAQTQSRVASKRASATFLRNSRAPKPTSQNDLAAVLKDVEKLEGHDKWISRIVDGEFETVTESVKREFSDTQTLEREISELTEKLAAVVDNESAIPALPPKMDSVGPPKRGDLLSPVSNDEARVLHDYLGRLQRGSAELQREADALMYQRKKLYPNTHYDDAMNMQQAGMDAGEEFSTMEMRRLELEAAKARGSMTMSEYKELDAMPPRKAKVWSEDDYARADKLAGEMREGVPGDGYDLINDTGLNKELLPGAEMQREARRLLNEAQAAEAAFKQAKRILGVSDDMMKAAAPGGKIGDVIQYDMGYAARKAKGGQGNWVDSMLETPESLKEYASEAFEGNWNAARKAFPKETSGKNGFDDLTPTAAATVAGGRARTAGKDSARGRTISAKAVELQELQAMKSVIRKLDPKQRSRLWIDARDLSSQNRNRASVERMALERQIKDKSGELLEQMDEAAKLRSAASSERKVAAELQDQVDTSIGGPLADMNAASTSVAAGERSIAQADEAAKALDAKWSSTSSAREAEEKLLVQELKGEKARLTSNADRIRAVVDEVGEKQAREMQDFDAARKAHKATAKDQEKALDDLMDRREQLLKTRRKLNKARKDKLGPRKGVTDSLLEKRMEEYKSLLDDAIADPSDLNARAAADLYDQWSKLSTKMERLGQGADDLGEVLAAAQRGAKGKGGGLALDMQAGYVDGFQSLRSALYPEVDGLPIDIELNRMLTNFLNTTQEDMHIKYLDEATQFFKSYATATPGFHVRNFMGASFMNFSDGVTVKHSREAFKLWRAYQADRVGFLAKQTDQTIIDAFDAVFGAGAGGSFDPGEIGTGLAKIGKAAQSNRVLRKSRKVGEDMVEGPVRLAAALDATRQGADMSMASARVARLHFDYADLSKLDKRMKKLIPFYMFMSRNLPLQVEQMWRRPKAYSMYNHFMNNVSVEGEEDEFMPEWMRAAGGVVIGRDGMFGAGKDTVLMPDMQHTGLLEDIESFGGGDGRFPVVDGLLAAGNPFLTKPAELAMNRSGFMGGELIRDYGKDANGKSYEKSEGEKWKERAAYAAGSLFTPIGSAQRLSGTSAQGGFAGAKAEDRQLQAIANFLGIPVKQLGERERTAEALRREFEDQGR